MLCSQTHQVVITRKEHASKFGRPLQQLFIGALTCAINLSSKYIDTAEPKLVRDCTRHVNIHVQRDWH